METVTATKPKLGFAGVGWIGKNRLEAILKSRHAKVMSVVDPNTEAVETIKSEISGIKRFKLFETLLQSDVDGIVLATPSALHASQALAAIQHGKAVFCQKPLGRNRAEATEVVKAARTHDVLLAVDFSYRYIDALQIIKKSISSGALGSIYGIELTFHNAYGPDKDWYYNRSLAGGGCLIDLGIHLVDLLFWIFDKPKINVLSSRLYYKGKPLKTPQTTEDYVVSHLIVNNEISVQLNCSWNLPAGKDAVIEARFYGQHSGLTFRNVGGSFYDFVAEKHSKTTTDVIAEPPEAWQGRAAVAWVQKLAEGNRFDSEVETYPKVAKVLDQIYEQAM